MKNNFLVRKLDSKIAKNTGKIEEAKKGLKHVEELEANLANKKSELTKAEGKLKDAQQSVRHSARDLASGLKNRGKHVKELNTNTATFLRDDIVDGVYTPYKKLKPTKTKTSEGLRYGIGEKIIRDNKANIAVNKRDIRSALKNRSKARAGVEEAEGALKGYTSRANLEGQIGKATKSNDKLNKLKPVAQATPAVVAGTAVATGAGTYAYKSKKDKMKKNAFDILEEGLIKQASAFKDVINEQVESIMNNSDGTNKRNKGIEIDKATKDKLEKRHMEAGNERDIRTGRQVRDAAARDLKHVTGGLGIAGIGELTGVIAGGKGAYNYAVGNKNKAGKAAIVSAAGFGAKELSLHHARKAGRNLNKNLDELDARAEDYKSAVDKEKTKIRRKASKK